MQEKREREREREQDRHRVPGDHEAKITVM